MLDITKDSQSLTTFRTVKGKAAAIVQDAEAFQRLLDMGAQADAEEGIRQGRGRGGGQGPAGEGVLRRIRNAA